VRLSTAVNITSIYFIHKVYQIIYCNRQYNETCPGLQVILYWLISSVDCSFKTTMCIINLISQVNQIQYVSLFFISKYNIECCPNRLASLQLRFMVDATNSITIWNGNIKYRPSLNCSNRGSYFIGQFDFDLHNKKTQGNDMNIGEYWLKQNAIFHVQSETNMTTTHTMYEITLDI
jgi:hypothetical protein